MDTIYVVTVGEYSSTAVLATFSTAEAARAFVERQAVVDRGSCGASDIYSLLKVAHDPESVLGSDHWSDKEVVAHYYSGIGKDSPFEWHKPGK